MSAESIEWLNTYTLQSRRAWHTSDQLQKLTNTVYDGPIPVADVHSRLFSWEPAEGSVDTTATVLSADGVETFTLNDPNRKTICRPPRALGPNDAGAILGVFKSGYQPHSYEKWLLNNVATILDDDLGIFSAGLLRGGAQAWVQVSVPDSFATPEGVEFRPNLLAVTSFDGSLSTTYKGTTTNTVCDNTMGVALGEAGRAYKVKHSRYSDLKIMEAREALALVHTIADDFAAEVAALCNTTVTDSQWDQFLASLAPTKDENGKDKTGRSFTMATNKQAALRGLWSHDTRVTPWKNTAWGVVQAVNTYTHHVQSVRGSDRDERNMALAVSGGFDKLDTSTLESLTAVLP